MDNILHPANLLTLTRLVLSPLVFWLILQAETDLGVSWAVFGLAVVVGFTDFFDGRVARRSSLESNSGAFLDPLADKIVVLGSGFCLVSVGRLWWLPITLIAIREVAITAWRTRWASEGVAIPARKSAKYKTFIQGVALSLAVFPPLQHFEELVVVVLWLAVVFTFVSGAQYLQDGMVASRVRTQSGANGANVQKDSQDREHSSTSEHG